MSESKNIKLKNEVRLLVVMPFRLYDLSSRFENDKIKDILINDQRDKELSNVKSKFEQSFKEIEINDEDGKKEITFNIIKGQYVGLPEMVSLKKNFLVSIPVKYKDKKIDNNLYLSNEKILYFGYGYGCVIADISNKINDLDKFSSCMDQLREILINLKEAYKFPFQTAIINAAKSIDEKNADPFTYGFSVTVILEEDKNEDDLSYSSGLFEASEKQIFKASAIFCKEDSIAKDINHFKVIGISGLSYINHGFTGSFIVTSKPKENGDIKVIEGIHNYLYLIISTLIDLTNIIHTERKELINIGAITEKNIRDRKIKHNKLKILRDLADIILFEAQPAMVCGTETEYAIYGKTWKLGEFGEYTDILKSQSEYLSRSISEIDSAIKNYHNEKTNGLLVTISSLSIVAISVALVTFCFGDIKYLIEFANCIKLALLVGINILLGLVVFVLNKNN